jgi:antitoxin component HigA of HigAB toxin-antitoxin module
VEYAHALTKKEIMIQAYIQHWNALQDSLGGILRPIEDDAHYDEVAEFLDTLREQARDQPHLVPLTEIVTNLIVVYDQQHPLPLATPDAMLAFYMQQQAMNQNALARATGIDQSLISKHLQAKRPISRTDATRYAGFFGVPVAVFLRN